MRYCTCHKVAMVTVAMGMSFATDDGNDLYTHTDICLYIHSIYIINTKYAITRS